jgi:branched-chain amino acid aminotransferase
MGARTSELTFRVNQLQSRVSRAERERLLANPGFGQIFTEHMVRIQWNKTRGWHDAELTAYGPVSLDPGTVVLHYAQAVFEGLKVFRQADGAVAAFRPDAHAVRFRASARRLALPELPEDTFVEAIDLLLEADHEWVPSAPDHSLYLRPLMYASEVTLSVHPADFPKTSAARPRAEPVRPKPAATTRAACSPRRRRPSKDATRWSGSTRRSTGGSRRWAA